MILCHLVILTPRDRRDKFCPQPFFHVAHRCPAASEVASVGQPQNTYAAVVGGSFEMNQLQR